MNMTKAEAIKMNVVSPVSMMVATPSTTSRTAQTYVAGPVDNPVGRNGEVKGVGV